MAGTAAWIDVLPNLSAFGTKLNSGVTVAAASAGRNAGKRFSDAMNQAASGDVLSEQVKSLEAAEKRAQKAVNAATAQIAKARDEQKSASLRAQAAETRLSETVAKYGASSAQALNAQARLNDARRKARQKDEAFKNAEEQIRAAQNGLKETQNQLTDAQRKASNTTGGFRATLAKWKAAADAAKSSTGTLTEAQTRLGEASRRTAARFSAMAGAVGRFASGIAGKAIVGITSLGSSMVDASDSAQKFASTMGFADMDADTIRRLTASTQEYADKTVFDLSDIRNTTSQLASNGVKNYDKLAEAAGNLTAVAGGGAEAYKSIAMVLTQTAGAGKLTTENWNQLSDAIPGASGKLQAAMKKNGAYTGNFRDAMEDGQISAEEFNKAIMQLGMTDVVRQAAESTTTFEGAMGNWEAAVQKLGMTVLDKVKPQLTGGLNSLTDRVSRFTDWFSGAWDGLAAFLETGRVNNAFAKAFRIDKNATASIEDAYRRIRLGYEGLTTFIKEGRFNTAFEGVDGDVMVDLRQNLLDVRDAASELLKNLPGLGAFFDTPKDGDKSNLAKVLKVVNVTLHGIKPLLDLLTTMEKAWNNLSAEQQGTILDTAIYLWLGSKGVKILKNVWGVGKGIAKAFKTAGSAVKSVGTFIGGLKAPKWLTSLLKTGGKLFRTGGKLSFAAPAATMAGTAVVTGQTAEHGTPKWVWTMLQKLQGKGTSDKAYARYQREYKANSERKILGVSGNQAAHALNPVNWPGMIASGAGKAWDGLKTAAMTSGQAQADTASMQVQAQQAGLEQVKKAWRDATGWINDNWCDLMVKIQGRFDAAVDWVESGWQGVCGWFSGIGASIGGFFAGVPAAIGGFFDSAGQWAQTKWQGVCGWFSGIPGSITGFFTGIPDTFGSLFQTAKDRITGIFGSVGGWFDTNVRTPIHDAIHAIGQTFESTKDWIRRSWDQVGDAAKSPVKFIVDTVYDKGIKKVWNSVAGAVGLKLALPDVKFANGGTVGGINPGYAPGVDSIPAMTSPGEAWMVPEWTRAVGAENIYRWNALARHRGVQAVRDDMGIGHYAKGGIATPAQAIAKANSIHSGYAGMCLKFVQDCYNAAARFPSALAAWQGSTSRHALGKSVSGVPQGAPLYMTDGNPNGHVAIYLGGGRMRTTNSADGRIHTDPVSLWTGKYGYRLQGWTGDIEGQSIPGLGKGVISTALDAVGDMLSDIGDWVRSRIVDPVKRMVSGIGGGG